MLRNRAMRVPAALARDSLTRLRMRYRRILCPTDFSEPAREALRTATELAAHQNAVLTLLHIHEPTLLSPPHLIVEEVETGLAQWRREAQDLGVPRVEAVSAGSSGPASDTLIRRAREGSFDLIVIGSGTPSFVEKVVRHAPCPVLVVKPKLEPDKVALGTKVGIRALETS